MGALARLDVLILDDFAIATVWRPAASPDRFAVERV